MAKAKSTSLATAPSITFTQEEIELAVMALYRASNQLWNQTFDNFLVTTQTQVKGAFGIVYSNPIENGVPKWKLFYKGVYETLEVAFRKAKREIPTIEGKLSYFELLVGHLITAGYLQDKPVMRTLDGVTENPQCVVLTKNGVDLVYSNKPDKGPRAASIPEIIATFRARHKRSGLIKMKDEEAQQILNGMAEMYAEIASENRGAPDVFRWFSEIAARITEIANDVYVKKDADDE